MENDPVKPDRDEKGLFVIGTSIHRPTKLTDKFLDKMQEILTVGMRVIIYTDEQMIEATNEELPEKERMSMSTWKEHKAKMLSSNYDDLTDTEKRFTSIIKRLLREQKEGLFNKLGTDDKAWTRWAWIIERKFDEWNIRHKVEGVFSNEIDEKIKKLNNIIDYVNEEEDRIIEDETQEDGNTEGSL